MLTTRRGGSSESGSIATSSTRTDGSFAARSAMAKHAARLAFELFPTGTSANAPKKNARIPGTGQTYLRKRASTLNQPTRPLGFSGSVRIEKSTTLTNEFRWSKSVAALSKVASL